MLSGFSFVGHITKQACTYDVTAKQVQSSGLTAVFIAVVRVGIDLIKLIKSSIKSLIKSMRINQGIDLFDFFKIICTHVITSA